MSRPVPAPEPEPVKPAIPKRVESVARGIARADLPPEVGAAKSGRSMAEVKFGRTWRDARPAAHPGVDAKKVDQAIERGVAFLKKQAGMEVLLGSKALAGLALLHSDVPARDPVIQFLAQEVRSHAGRRFMPYDLAPCIWFLDRLGDKKDSPLIRSLALRLIAGQQADGGWGYSAPFLAHEQERALLKLLGAPDLPVAPARGGPPGGPFAHLGGKVPPDLAWLPVLRHVPGKGVAAPDAGKTAIVLVNRSDNSLTQFAILGLWVARRHGVPVERSLVMAEERFRASQAGDGSWTYESAPRVKGDFAVMIGRGGFRDTATCAGLITLASASAVRKGEVRADPAIDKGFEFLSRRHDTYRFLDPLTRRKQAIQLSVLFHTFESTHGLLFGGEGIKPGAGGLDLGKLMKLAEGGGGGLGIGGVPERGAWFGAEAWGDLYYLWSLERVAAVYDLKTIGKWDWYGWGAPLILACQETDGSWREAFPPVADTAFALLFLRRANFFVDLSQAVDAAGLARSAGQRDQQATPFPPGQINHPLDATRAGRALGPGLPTVD